MDFETVAGLPRFGFAGGIRIRQLQGCCDEVDTQPGVYLVVRNSKSKPRFLKTSSGGHFKGRDPTVAVAKLEERWLRRPRVIYIGKAGGATHRTTLRRRIGQYMRFGAGQPCAHWGGRYIWQLADARNLVVYWKPTPGKNPRLVEKGMLTEFILQYGRPPFANIVR